MADPVRRGSTEEFSWAQMGERITSMAQRMTALWKELSVLHATVAANDDSPAVRHLDSSKRAVERSLVAIKQAQTVQELRAAVEEE